MQNDSQLPSNPNLEQEEEKYDVVNLLEQPLNKLPGEADYQQGMNFYWSMNNTATNNKKAFDFFQQAAVQKHPCAIAHIGFCYYFGNGVAYNTIKAVKQFLDIQPELQQLAEDNNADAQYCLGVIYSLGKGGIDNQKESDAKAVKWYTQAAEQGERIAQLKLGRMYRNGRGGIDNQKESDAEAMKWYTQAAEQGEWIAQYELGWMYKNGRGGIDNQKESDAEAMKWYQKAARNGDENAQYNLDVYCKSARCFFKEALTRLNNNDPELTGLDLDYFRLTNIDLDQLESALKNNTHLKQLDLRDNKLTINNVKSLSKVFIEQTQLDEVTLTDNPVDCSKAGKTVINTFQVALQVERGKRTVKELSNEQLHSYAQYLSGRLYPMSNRKESDAEAVKCYIMLAQKNHVPSQCSLGWMYANYRGGIADKTQSQVMAVKWYQKAIENGVEKAKEHLHRGWSSLAYKALTYYLDALGKDDETLVSLDLRYFKLKDKQVEWLSQKLQTNTHLKRIDLRYNELSVNSVKTLSNLVVKNQHITEVIMTDNPVNQTKDGQRFIEQALDSILKLRQSVKSVEKISDDNASNDENEEEKEIYLNDTAHEKDTTGDNENKVEEEETNATEVDIKQEKGDNVNDSNETLTRDQQQQITMAFEFYDHNQSALKSAVKKEQLSQTVDHEMELIRNNPRLQAYYYTFIKTLNATFSAAAVIYSGQVDQKISIEATMSIETVAAVITKLLKHFHLEKFPGGSIASSILASLWKRGQLIKINKLSSFFGLDPVARSNAICALGRALTLGQVSWLQKFSDDWSSWRSKYEWLERLATGSDVDIPIKKQAVNDATQIIETILDHSNKDSNLPEQCNDQWLVLLTRTALEDNNQFEATERMIPKMSGANQAPVIISNLGKTILSDHREKPALNNPADSHNNDDVQELRMRLEAMEKIVEMQGKRITDQQKEIDSLKSQNTASASFKDSNNDIEKLKNDVNELKKYRSISPSTVELDVLTGSNQSQSQLQLNARQQNLSNSGVYTRNNNISTLCDELHAIRQLMKEELEKNQKEKNNIHLELEHYKEKVDRDAKQIRDLKTQLSSHLKEINTLKEKQAMQSQQISSANVMSLNDSNASTSRSIFPLFQPSLTIDDYITQLNICSHHTGHARELSQRLANELPSRQLELVNYQLSKKSSSSGWSAWGSNNGFDSDWQLKPNDQYFQILKKLQKLLTDKINLQNRSAISYKK